MTFAPRWSSFVLGAFGCVIGSFGMAQDWPALVVGDTGQGAGRAFADSYYAAEAVQSWGSQAPVLLRNTNIDAVDAAFADLRGHSRLVLYYAGPLADDMMRVDGRDVPLAPRIETLADDGLRHLLLLVENCAGDTDRASALPDPGISNRFTLVIAASAEAGAACPVEGERLSDALRNASKPSAAPVSVLVPFLRQGSAQQLPQVEVIPPETASADTPRSDQVMITDVVRVTPASAPANIPASASVGLTPVRSPGTTEARPLVQPDAQSQVMIFSPVPSPQLAEVPRAEGLPEPSIIVGLVEGADQRFSAALDPSDLSGSEISYDSVEARQQLQRQNPELFANLVSSGAFDPPGPVLVQALQQELARMGCYTSRVDGAWGPGSQRAVQRYYTEVGVPAPTQAASVSLFRAIIGREDVTCTQPIAAISPPRTTTAPAASRPAAQAPANPAPAQTQIAPGAALGGVFR